MYKSLAIELPAPYGHAYDLDELADFVEAGIKAGLRGLTSVHLSCVDQHSGIVATFSKPPKSVQPAWTETNYCERHYRINGKIKGKVSMDASTTDWCAQVHVPRLRILGFHKREDKAKAMVERYWRE